MSRFEQEIRKVKVYLISESLRECRGNQCKAARLLGLHRNTLTRNMQELGVFNHFRSGRKNSQTSYAGNGPIFSTEKSAS